MLDQADGQAFALEQRALLDVQFDECVVAARRQRDRFEFPAKAGLPAELLERAALRIAQSAGPLQRQSAGEQPAAEAAQPEAGRLLGGEHDRLERTTGLESAAPESLQSREAAQSPDHAVETAGVGDGVRVRARGHGGQRRFPPRPAGKKVSHRVLPHLQPGGAGSLPDHLPRAHVGLGIENPGDDRRRRRGNAGQVVDFPRERAAIDGENHSGRRFTSL